MMAEVRSKPPTSYREYTTRTMSQPQDQKPKPEPDSTEKNMISIDPGTLVLIISLLILIPLIVTGFTAQ